MSSRSSLRSASTRGLMPQPAESKNQCSCGSCRQAVIAAAVEARLVARDDDLDVALELGLARVEPEALALIVGRAGRAACPASRLGEAAVEEARRDLAERAVAAHRDDAPVGAALAARRSRPRRSCPRAAWRARRTSRRPRRASFTAWSMRSAFLPLCAVGLPTSRCVLTRASRGRRRRALRSPCTGPRRGPRPRAAPRRSAAPGRARRRR